MGIALLRRVAHAGTAAAVAVALAGCGQGAAGTSRSTATAPLRRPVVSLLTVGGGPLRVVGGTPAMRARAREILDGMGAMAIAEVRFGRAPASFGRFRRMKGPTWLSTTVRSRGTPFAAGLRRQLSGDGPLWEASVFENAYLGSQPVDQPRIRGTSEAFSLPSGVRRFASGTASIPEYGGRRRRRPPPGRPSSKQRQAVGSGSTRSRSSTRAGRRPPSSCGR